MLAQALMAAARTVLVSRVVHSLHAYFLLPGADRHPDRLRRGGGPRWRVVLLPPGGGAAGRQGHLLPVQLVPRDGGRLRARGPVPEGVPGPDECPKLGEVLAKISGRSAALWEREWGVLDVRYVGDSRPGGSIDDAHPARARVWVRADGVLPDDRRLHQAALAYASDLTLLSATTVPHNVLSGSRPGRITRPRDVVPPAVPSRRMAALRPDLADGLPGPRPGHRPPLPARRPGRQRRPRRPDPPDGWPSSRQLTRSRRGRLPSRAGKGPAARRSKGSFAIPRWETSPRVAHRSSSIGGAARWRRARRASGAARSRSEE